MAEKASDWLVSDTHTFAELCDDLSRDTHSPQDLLPIPMRPSLAPVLPTVVVGLPPSVPCIRNANNHSTASWAPPTVVTDALAHNRTNSPVSSAPDGKATRVGMETRTPSQTSEGGVHTHRHRSRADRSTANTPTQRHRPCSSASCESGSSDTKSTRPHESRTCEVNHTAGSAATPHLLLVTGGGGGSGESSRRGTASTVKYTSTQATLLPPAPTSAASPPLAAHVTATTTTTTMTGGGGVVVHVSAGGWA